MILTKAYLGSTEIKKAYLGSTLVFDNTNNYPLANIISEYKFEDNVLDTVGSNNGTSTSITYVTDGVGRSSVFNGGTSKVDIADSVDLSFTDGSDLPFSISLLFTISVDQKSMFISKRDDTYSEYQFGYDSNLNQLQFDIMSGGHHSNYKRELFTFNPVIGQIYHFVGTYSGRGRQSVYLDSVLQTSTELVIGTYTSMTNTTANVRIGKGGWTETSGVWSLDGKLDVVRIWDKELTQTEITAIASAELAGTDINP